MNEGRRITGAADCIAVTAAAEQRVGVIREALFKGAVGAETRALGARNTVANLQRVDAHAAAGPEAACLDIEQVERAASCGIAQYRLPPAGLERRLREQNAVIDPEFLRGLSRHRSQRLHKTFLVTETLDD